MNTTPIIVGTIAVIPGAALARASMHSAVKDIRCYLNGVAILHDPSSGRDILVGTDGHQMYVEWLGENAVTWGADDQTPDGATICRQIIITSDHVKQLVKASVSKNSPTGYADITIEVTADNLIMRAAIAHPSKI
jgi:hypothetical protein